MPEIVADRSSILRSKRQESSSIATSRKRKLREFWAVSAYDGSHIKLIDIDTPAPTPAEAQFLELNDILQGRVLNEASIPARQQLRSALIKGFSSGPTGQVFESSDAPRLPKGLRDEGFRKSRWNPPGKELIDGPPISHQNFIDTSRPGCSTDLIGDDDSSLRSTFKSVQTCLSPGSVSKLGVNGGPAKEFRAEDSPLPLYSLEERRVKSVVENRPRSLGVYPRRASLISADDVADLSVHINGSQDENHKAVTALIPPNAEQEEQLCESEESVEYKFNDEQKEGRFMSIGSPHNVRNTGDPMSSPGSTVDAQSATTPALHEASTDTSPDNEGSRYNLERADEKDGDTRSSTQLTPSKEEIPEKGELEGLSEAHMDIAHTEILGNSPTAEDTQLQLGEERATSTSHESENGDLESDQLKVDIDQGLSSNSVDPPNAKPLIGEASELAQDVIDEDDEVVGVPTPDDKKVQSVDTFVKPVSNATDGATQVTVTTSGNMVVDTAVIDTERLDVTAPPIPSILGKDTAEDSMAGRVEAPSTSTPTSSPRRASVTIERMTTRVSSGAMRHKSVSEILGDMSRPNTAPILERTSGKVSTDLESTIESNVQSRDTSPQSPASRMRSMVERAKEKERSKLNTVVFAKQQLDRTPSSISAISNGAKSPAQDSREYFMPLIITQAYNATRGMQSLESLLQTSHKTITTSNSYIPFLEHQTQKVLRRIHALQSMDKWSFRQPKRSSEPNRPLAHRDELLKEAKWMRTDFREERKWKASIAKSLAYACAEWVKSNSYDRKLLQVKAIIPPKVSTDTEMSGVTVSTSLDVSHSSAELISSTENDSTTDDFDGEPRAGLLNVVAPAALFSLSDDDVIFGLKRSAATDRLLEELPLHGLPLKVHQTDLPTSDMDPDATWRRLALPLNKYIDSKIILKDEGPPKKRSRYQYEEEDDEDDEVAFDGHVSRRIRLEPVLTDVALFNPENKHIRDRIHAGHQFRPPSEYPMPLQSFFECRSSSQWTWAEQDELKALVREYSYNWQLISSMLSSRSLFSSSAERRTPWECFERWIHLEGLPSDMQKTHYFRAYNNRIEAAQRNLNQTTQAPSQSNGAVMAPVRWRTTTGVRVEKRRNQKHLTLVDAMRKLAKKRETNHQKQQHAASLAAMRKANEGPQSQGGRHTPQYFSRLKYEHELQMQERMNRLQLQQEAQRRVLQQARSAQQQNSQQYANGTSQQRNSATANAISAANLPPNTNRPNQLAVPSQNLPHAPLQPLSNGMVTQSPMANGHGPVPQMALKGVPQAQMQGLPNLPSITNMPPQHRLPALNPAPDLQLVIQARRISEQQRQAVQMQQQQHQGPNPQVHNSPPNMRPNMNNINQQALMQNSQAMMAAFNIGNGSNVSTPPANGFNAPVVGSAGSPRMTHPNQSQHPNGSISQASKLEAQCRARVPTATPDQINKMVRDTLNQNLARQSAMNAAAGSGTSLPSMPSGMQASPQQYAQMLRAQQEKQSAPLAQQNRSSSAGSNSALGK